MLGKLPQSWASNDNYSAGPDTGTATKVDPASQDNGFINGVGAAAQHVNYVLEQLTTAARRLFVSQTLHPRPFEIVGAAIDDLDASMAATEVNYPDTGPTGPVLLIKTGTNDVFQCYSGDPKADTAGTVASITSFARAAATDGARVVAIGTGGNLNTYSDDFGTSWTAGAAGVGGAVQYLCWNGTNFLSAGSGTGSVYRSPDAATIWQSAGSGFAAPFGLAVIGDASFTVVALGNSGIQPRFSKSTDDGATFTGTASPPDAATAEEPGSIDGCPFVEGVGAAAYHVMRCNAGARLRVNSSADGTNWVQTAVIEAPVGVVFTAAPRLMICKSTGLMVIVCASSDGTNTIMQLYVSQDGIDWAGPSQMRDSAITAYAVAGGRLFHCRSAALYGSDGVGF